MSLVVKSSLEALIHQSEVLDLVASCLSVDGKSPQYESPHEWVMGRVVANSIQRYRGSQQVRVAGRGSRAA